MLTIAVQKLYNRRREVLACLTDAQGNVSIIFRDGKGNVSKEIISEAQYAYSK